MSTRPGKARDVEGALEPHIQVKEKGKQTVGQYPTDIVDQLKRAAFIEGKAANTYVKRVNLTNDTSKPKVVTVEVQEDSLVINVEDVVGIVNLTPNSTLQIDPKSGIGWDDILDMFLTVSEQRRSLEYRGIPIREFLADDIGIEDIFIVVAANYLNSLDDIFRHGFIRSFDRQRTRALDARGRIDITSSLKNFDIPNGVPQHEFVQKTVEYSIPVNDIIYKAGQELQRLFRLYADVGENPSYARIFSRLERAMQQLKNRGITGNSVNMSDVPAITINDIPRQRHYYAQALEISKTILSSSIGQPLDQGRDELLMEYILGMESLFEEYSALVIEEEIESLKQNPMIDGLDGVTVEKESYQLFADDEISFSSQPDHVIKSDGRPTIVLDSKYYAKGKNPLKGSWSRSRLLSYGFHLETETLGMIAPLATPRSLSFAGRSGELTIISPEDDEFSTDGLRTVIQDYLRDHVGEQRDTNATADLQNRQVCHPDVEASVLNEVFDEQQLQADRVVRDSRVILQYIVKDARLSDKLDPRETRAVLGASRRLKRYLRKESGEYDIIVPLFIPADDKEAERIANNEELHEKRPELKDASEFIRIHCLAMDGDGIVTDYNSPPPFGLDW